MFPMTPIATALALFFCATALFQPALYVDRKPGTLHFEIPASDVGEMIRPGQQRQYSGSVTVIWDSEV
jgi:hypothetical protein